MKTILAQILEKEHAFCPPPATTEFAETIWSKRAYEPINRKTNEIMPESTPPKAPRTLDPDILRLRKQHFQNVMDLKRRRTSTKILQTIIEKRLPALTDEDIAKLLNAIGPKPVTAPLPPRPAPAVAAPQAPRPAQPMPGPVPPRKP